MSAKRFKRRLGLLAAGSTLLVYSACTGTGGNYIYDVAVSTATGLVTTSVATIFNSWVSSYLTPTSA